MDIKAVLIGIVVIVLVAIGAVFVLTPPKAAPAPATTEATSTPTAPATSTTPTPEPTPASTDTAALGERIYDNGVYITPLAVLEDSRCPMGVYCIQAGTVRLKAKLELDGHVETTEFVIGSPVAFGNRHIALMSVAPVKKAGVTIAPSDYRFTFSVAYGMGEGF